MSSAVERDSDTAAEAMETEEVEELLDMVSPMSASSPTHHRPESTRGHPISLSTTHHSSSSSSHPYQNMYYNLESIDPSQSTFATTDPFYAAAQAPQPQSNSFFAQAGRPAQTSPFYAHTQPPPNRPIPFPLTLDTGPRYVAAAGFDG